MHEGFNYLKLHIYRFNLMQRPYLLFTQTCRPELISDGSIPDNFEIV